MCDAEHCQGQRQSLTMGYSFWDRLTMGKDIACGGWMPRCEVCRARMRKRGMPRLFLLPVHQNKSYEASATYYSKVCRPLAKVEDIPVGQRACRMWPLVCPECEARAVLVVDFLRVRGQEVPEETVVCDYAPLAALLNGTGLEKGPVASEIQSFGYEEVMGNGRK